MVDYNADKASSEIKSLVSDAQDLFNAATTASADKAARDLQDTAMKTGKELASTADDYVHDNPWKTIAISAGVALLIGALLTPIITRK
jgi:ElaB/YqjD/DUF883 family membrane-anchored ribosome-binding protein